MAEVKLNQQQIEKLAEIAQHFPEVQHFTVETDHSSGIGVGIQVRFDLFDTRDTCVDITDENLATMFALVWA